ncbi:unnamed protein product [Paramecium pentaurelia]|uniref:Uncharacterized protein n=1 Tax=Paramecium pentaurelia TaxID=43138 RepID=A0A8S1WN92_9CILI|nr:unnamed protein product [Paramecium pentaurelia]
MQIRCTQVDHQNQYITGFCIDNTCPNQRPYCHFCLPSHVQHINKLTSQELLSGWIKEKSLIIQNVQKNIQECEIALNSLINVILPYNNFNIQQLPDLGLSQIDLFIKGLCLMGECDEKLFKQLIQSIEQTKSIVNEILKKIKNQKIIKQNDNLQIPQQQPKNLSILEPNLNPFAFDLMKECSIKQDEWCSAIAFNKDQSIVVAGCKNDINVFQHLQGKLNQIQQLSEHTNYVYTLNFMKNTNNFVSGSFDSSIIIWQLIENNQWKCQQKLNGHSDSIYCLQINNTDDLIISGSVDETIKFWMKQDQWLCQQTITDHTNIVYSLSLNEQQNRLISCSDDSQILVIAQQMLDKKWSVTQRIKVDQWGYKLCFIDDNQFTFQPYCKEQMDIYEMDSNTKQYRKTKEIAVKFGSGIDNCQKDSQQIRMVIMLIQQRRNKMGSLQFNNPLSLILISKEIQIRKCREL